MFEWNASMLPPSPCSATSGLSHRSRPYLQLPQRRQGHVKVSTCSHDHVGRPCKGDEKARRVLQVLILGAGGGRFVRGVDDGGDGDAVQGAAALCCRGRALRLGDVRALHSPLLHSPLALGTRVTALVESALGALAWTACGGFAVVAGASCKTFSGKYTQCVAVAHQAADRASTARPGMCMSA